jgi:2'-5' RNA ligase
MDNSDKVRLFIGIKITPSIKTLSVINELKQHFFESEIKWVNQENYHITLKFLGETPEYYIKSIDRIIKQTLNNIRTFRIELNGCDFFGRKSPQTIWIGLQQTEKLKSLQNELNESLQELGFASETKNFVPHLTIGRVKKPRTTNFEFIKVIEKTSGKINEPFDIKQANLIQSKLKSSGPEYKTLKTYILHS